DVTGRMQTYRRRDDRGWDALVKDLSSADATKAFAAQRALAAGANLSVAQMAKRVKRAEGKSLSDRDLAELVKKLDDDQDARTAAFEALAGQGKAAEATLRRALAGEPSAQLKRSASALLDRLTFSSSPESMRAARLAEVLEWIGTAEAKRLL